METRRAAPVLVVSLEGVVDDDAAAGLAGGAVAGAFTGVEAAAAGPGAGAEEGAGDFSITTDFAAAAVLAADAGVLPAVVVVVVVVLDTVVVELVTVGPGLTAAPAGAGAGEAATTSPLLAADDAALGPGRLADEFALALAVEAAGLLDAISERVVVAAADTGVLGLDAEAASEGLRGCGNDWPLNVGPAVRGRGLDDSGDTAWVVTTWVVTIVVTSGGCANPDMLRGSGNAVPAAVRIVTDGVRPATAPGEGAVAEVDDGVRPAAAAEEGAEAEAGLDAAAAGLCGRTTLRVVESIGDGDVDGAAPDTCELAASEANVDVLKLVKLLLPLPLLLLGGT
jgi:hypothetical protein